jgi:hypothetical protein
MQRSETTLMNTRFFTMEVAMAIATISRVDLIVKNAAQILKQVGIILAQL